VPKDSASLPATLPAYCPGDTCAGALVMGENRNPQSQVAKTIGKEPKSISNADDFSLMSVEELWNIHQKVEAVLGEKIDSELIKLGRRLTQLNAEVHIGPRPNRKDLERHSKRRPYPKVLPKYRNPAQPSETWSGRGRTPRWVAAQLSQGKKIDDFRIK
jgi:DNA-binding protein H-NS